MRVPPKKEEENQGTRDKLPSQGERHNTSMQGILLQTKGEDNRQGTTVEGGKLHDALRKRGKETQLRETKENREKGVIFQEKDKFTFGGGKNIEEE